MSQHPLRDVSKSQLLELCITVFSWSVCHDCSNPNPTAPQCRQCPANRTKRLNKYLDTYRTLTSAYAPDDVQHPALASHGDVFELIRLIRTNSGLTRKEITKIAFPHETLTVAPSINDQHTAVNLALRAMTMINYTINDRGCNLLEAGLYQSPWSNDSRIGEFLNGCFPTSEHPELNNETEVSYLDIRRALKARKLQKHAGIKFRGTNNIRRHLMLDRKTNIVEIFHHTSFLKEHLRLTKDCVNDVSFDDCMILYVLLL